MQIEIEALEEMVKIEQAIGTAEKYSDLVVKTFYKAAGQQIQEIVGNRLPVAMQGLEEAIETEASDFRTRVEKGIMDQVS